MSSAPLVTIGFPVYNGGERFEAALGAIRAQTWRNLDILISDNASTDRTEAVCRRAASEDPRIRYVRQPRNVGPIANFTFVRRQRRGEFFAWAAHDDVHDPTYFEKTAKTLLENERAVLAHSWTRIERADGSSFIDRAFDEGALSGDPVERLRAFFRCTYNVAIYGLHRSSALDRIPESEEWLEADKFHLFSAILNGPIAIVPETLFHYRMTHTLDYYKQLFPFKGDHVLERYRRYPRQLEAAPLDPAAKQRVREALDEVLRPMLQRRLEHLIAELLQDPARGRRRLTTMARWITQYPPALRSRMVWGAVRHIAFT
jgi:glycosyltransferase involved in cell wall biosynthesis